MLTLTVIHMTDQHVEILQYFLLSFCSQGTAFTTSNAAISVKHSASEKEVQTSTRVMQAGS